MRLTGRWLVGLAVSMALSAGCSSGNSEETGTGGTAGMGGEAGNGGDAGIGGDRFRPDPYAANICIGSKQTAAGAFCASAIGAWADFALDGDTASRDDAIVAARAALDAAWSAAEDEAQAENADCENLALESGDAGDGIAGAADQIYAAIVAGLNLEEPSQAQCAVDLMSATADACAEILGAEGVHIADLHEDPDRSVLDAATAEAIEAWSAAWDIATAGDCPTEATQEQLGDQLGAAIDDVVLNTIVAPGVDSEAYVSLVPGETIYKGRTFTPTCITPGSEYRYFAKRGTVNKLLMYYQGGGACWDGLTCGIPTCSPDATEGDNPNGRTTGFADLSNANNPFKDWHIVFVTYCTCDIHFGDTTQEYTDDLTIEHRGYHNSQVAEKWAREHFYDPEEVFITGSSAGAYGAWFNAPLLNDVWAASQTHVLADAGNGVITQEFLTNEFSNWNFVQNLPEYIPGVEEALDPSGDGMPDYTEAVATYFPQTNWAHYSTVYDGSPGGQTGFYNIMLQENPLGAQLWWEASCQFGDVVREQSAVTFEAVPDNYRYYFGTGSRHTMWGSDKVYDDTTGGVPTVVDWINGMLASGPDGRDPAWANIEASNPGLLLDGDPRPDPLLTPFEASGEDTVIVCE